MKLVFMESSDASAVQALSRWLASYDGAVEVVQVADFAPQLQAVARLKLSRATDLYPAFATASNYALQEIAVELQTLGAELYGAGALANAAQETTKHLLHEVGASLAAARVIYSPAKYPDGMLVFTRWTQLHARLRRRAAEVTYETRAAASAWQPWRRIGATIIDSLKYVAVCGAALIGGARRGVAVMPAPHVGFFGGTDSPLRWIAPMFEDCAPSSVYFHLSQHIALGQTYRQRLAQSHAVIPQIVEKGWGWRLHRDRNVWRACLAVVRTIGRACRALLRSEHRQVATVMLRTATILERFSWEVRDLLRAVPLKLLVAGFERGALGHLLAEVCRERGCKVLGVFSGYFTPDDPQISPPAYDAWALWGEFVPNIMRAAGVVAATVHFTGHPLEGLWWRGRQQRQNLGAPSTPRLLFFSQPHVASRRDMRPEIMAILKRLSQLMPQLEIIVKPHPSEDLAFLRHAAAGAERLTLLTVPQPPQELILQASLVLSVNSTTLLEALAMGVPVAICDPNRYLSRAADLGAGIDLYGRPDAAADLAALLNDKQRLEAMAKLTDTAAAYFVGTVDGQATRRIAALIRQLSGNAD